MIELDLIAPNYRRAAERWPEAPTLSSHYQALVGCYNGSGYGLVEITKSFIECVCRTILGEFTEEELSSRATTTEMLVKAMEVLGLKRTRETGQLNSLISAHAKLANALSDMRDNHGPIAHGKDGFLDALTDNHLRAYLLTGDTLLCLVLSALDGTNPDLQYTREPYERFHHLHNRIDRSVTVDVAFDDDERSPVISLVFSTESLPDGVSLLVEPSRLLYALDRTAYIELLAASTAKAVSEQSQEESPGTVSTLPDLSPVEQRVSLPPLEQVPSYEGILLPFRDPLKQYLDTLGISESAADHSLLDSLLTAADSGMGTDWTSRDTLQAGMKVAFKRILSHFGIVGDDANKTAEYLVTWLKMQAHELPKEENTEAE